MISVTLARPSKWGVVGRRGGGDMSRASSETTEDRGTSLIKTYANRKWSQEASAAYQTLRRAGRYCPR